MNIPIPMAVGDLVVDGPIGPIEARVETADTVDALDPRAVAIVCHPLSTEGGTMHNKVVTTTARALRECGALTVRFNFRGVGASAGAFDDGNGEADDLRAVIARVRAAYPDTPLWLGGFSFGSYVALKVASASPPALLVSIAPPVGRRWEMEAMPAPDVPWIVVQGDEDEVVDAAEVHAWLDALPPRTWPPHVVRMPGATHFFHGRLIDLRGAVRNGVIALLGEATA